MYTCCSKIGKRWRQRSASVAASTAKVGLSQVLVLQELLGGAAQDATAGRKDVAAIDNRERHVRILLHDQHRDAGLVHLLDDLEASLDKNRREPHRRLVHQQE